MSEETRNRRGRIVLAAGLAVLVAALMSPYGVIALAGYLDCRSGKPLPDVTLVPFGPYTPCAPWRGQVSGVTGEPFDVRWQLYYSFSQGHQIRDNYGNFALFEVIWARLRGVRPEVGGGRDHAG